MKYKPWKYGTPPKWMRHYISWKIMGWIDARYEVCWAAMVMWKLGYEWDWEHFSDCKTEDDYCGKYKST